MAYYSKSRSFQNFLYLMEFNGVKALQLSITVMMLTTPYWSSLVYASNTANNISTKSFRVAADGISTFHQRVADNRASYTQQILAQVFEPLSVSITYQRLPRERAKRLVQSGDIECMALAKNSLDGVIFSKEAWGYHELKLYSTKERKLPITRLEDLNASKRLSIGVMAGWSYDSGGPVDRFIQRRKDNPYIHASTSEDAFQQTIEMTKMGRIDTFIACPLWLRSQLANSNISIEEFEAVLDLSEQKIGLYFACSEQSPHSRWIIDTVNERLPELRDSGRLQSILQQHGHADWVQGSSQ